MDGSQYVIKFGMVHVIRLEFHAMFNKQARVDSAQTHTDINIIFYTYFS